MLPTHCSARGSACNSVTEKHHFLCWCIHLRNQRSISIVRQHRDANFSQLPALKLTKRFQNCFSCFQAWFLLSAFVRFTIERQMAAHVNVQNKFLNIKMSQYHNISYRCCTIYLHLGVTSQEQIFFSGLYTVFSCSSSSYQLKTFSAHRG